MTMPSSSETAPRRGLEALLRVRELEQEEAKAALLERRNAVHAL